MTVSAPEWIEESRSMVHPVLQTTLDGPWPNPHRVIILGMGCFWGAERIFWNLPGVLSTCVGYAAGKTAYPSYPLVCTGTTSHVEVVRVVYDSTQLSDEQVLQVFWENHDPTQGNRQGNDVGTQYRSLIAAFDSAQLLAAEKTRQAFGRVLSQAGYGAITTEIVTALPFNFESDPMDGPAKFGPHAPFFFLAEPYHQQYLFHNPDGYCNHGPNGFSCPVGLDTQS